MEYHTQQFVTRLKTIEGHVRGIERMTEADAYCIDIIKQTQAVQRALDKLNSLVIADHLQRGVTTAIRSDQLEERERVVTELLQVFRRASTADQTLPAPESGADRTAQRVSWLEQIVARVRSVQQMVAAGAYPIAIITQTQAIQGMLDAFNQRILADHLNGCVTTAIRNEQPAERERMIAELLQVFDTTSTL